jgi:hypothetical protein
VEHALHAHASSAWTAAFSWQPGALASLKMQLEQVESPMQAFASVPQLESPQL